MHFLLFGFNPFYNSNESVLYNMILKREINFELNKDIYDNINRDVSA